MFFVLVLVILLVLLYLVWRYGLRSLLNRPKKSEQGFIKQVEAPAVLLNFYVTGISKNNATEYSLQMQVQPVEGRNFVTETKQLVTIEDVRNLYIGSKLHVRYNPANKKDLALIKTPIGHLQQQNAN